MGGSKAMGSASSSGRRSLAPRSGTGGGGGGGGSSGKFPGTVVRTAPAPRIHEEDVDLVDTTLVLPDEILGLIFDRLDTRGRNVASLVCHRWLRAEANSRKILALSASSSLPISCLESSLIRFPVLSKLGLKCDRGLPSITDDALLLIALHCRRLSKLKLKNCTGLQDDGLVAFAKTVSPVSFRSFSCCSCGFGSKGLNAVIRNCVALEDLSVKKLRLGGGEPGQLVEGPSKLKRLSIKNILDGGHAFAPLIAGSKQLHTLIIFKATGQWDKLLELVVDGLPELTELRMEKLHLGDRGLTALAKCRKLQVLFLARTPEVTNAGLAAIANGCRLLRKLHIDGCYTGRIGDRGLIAVGERCPELKELVLIGVCVTSGSLTTLFKNCLGLERLAVWNSETFGDGELACIATKCRALRKLCIKLCPISDQGLEALAGGCPSLTKVKIKRCRGVTAPAAESLMLSHDGLIVTLEADPATLVEAQRGHVEHVHPAAAAAAAVAAAGGGQNRSPFSRARSAIVAALGRVLS